MTLKALESLAPVIKVHSLGKSKAGREWFTATVNGRPLLGDSGAESRFSTRQAAKSEALRRFTAEQSQPPEQGR